MWKQGRGTLRESFFWFFNCCWKCYLRCSKNVNMEILPCLQFASCHLLFIYLLCNKRVFSVPRSVASSRPTLPVGVPPPRPFHYSVMMGMASVSSSWALQPCDPRPRGQHISTVPEAPQLQTMSPPPRTGSFPQFLMPVNHTALLPTAQSWHHVVFPTWRKCLVFLKNITLNYHSSLFPLSLSQLRLLSPTPLRKVQPHLNSLQGSQGDHLKTEAPPATLM